LSLFEQAGEKSPRPTHALNNVEEDVKSLMPVGREKKSVGKQYKRRKGGAHMAALKGEKVKLNGLEVGAFLPTHLEKGGLPLFLKGDKVGPFIIEEIERPSTFDLSERRREEIFSFSSAGSEGGGVLNALDVIYLRKKGIIIKIIEIKGKGGGGEPFNLNTNLLRRKEKRGLFISDVEEKKKAQYTNPSRTTLSKKETFFPILRGKGKYSPLH